MYETGMLNEYLKNTGIKLDEAQLLQFGVYMRVLADWNSRMNLTAITDPEGVLIRHFTDSLLLCPCLPFDSGLSVCDVGSGAGFPGVCLKIARPEISLTLMDSVGKKTVFLRALLAELGLSAEVVQIRAEQAGLDPAFRGHFDVVTARAVAPLNVLAEYCVPLVMRGGLFAPMKAALTKEERRSGDRAAALLGAQAERTCAYTLPDGSAREIVLYRKKSPTPDKYPRPAAQIAKKAL